MASIKVKCSNCKHEFYMDEYERKTCPKCGKVAVGPKAKKPSGGCFVTTACVEAAGLPDNCTELETMRYLRDEYLAKSAKGREMIREYYEIAPRIVKAIKRQANDHEIFCRVFRDIKKVVSLINTGNSKEAIKEYKKMVLRLKQQYLPNSFRREMCKQWK